MHDLCIFKELVMLSHDTIQLRLIRAMAHYMTEQATKCAAHLLNFRKRYCQNARNRTSSHGIRTGKQVLNA